MKSYALATMLLIGCSQTESLEEGDVVALNDLIIDVLPAPSVPSTLIVYACPDLLTGCSMAAFKSGSTCYPVTPVAGKCIDTKVPIDPLSKVPLASCVDSNCNNCGQTANIITPTITFESTWYSGVSWFCRTQCTAPPTCQ